MSAVHRVDDIWSMDAARFFRLAWRLPCYRGAMRERAIAERREQDEAPQAAPVRAAAPERAAQARPRADTKTAPVTRDALNDPVLSKVFSFG
jgi:hypothetical protein